MPSTTSLLKSAASARKRVLAQQDAEVAFEWQNSAQTYQDFAEYSKYLEGRQAASSDPSQSLSYARTINAARRSYVSNEIQRSQMAIMEGRGNTEDKMNLVKDLFYQAQDNGDYNLAQNLLSQWDSLSIKAQNEAQTAAKAFAASGSKVKSDFLKKLEKGVDDVTLPNGEKVTPLSQIARDLENTGGSTATWKAAQDTLEAMRNVIIDQYKNATTQDEVDKLEEKYGAGLQDLDKEVTFKIGGASLNAQDVMNAVANEQMNNPRYSLQAIRNEATGKNEFKLKENNVDRLDYVRQIDPATGEEYYVPATIRTDQSNLMFGSSDQGRGLNTQITNDGAVIGSGGKVNAGTSEVKRDESQTIGNRLKNFGIDAKDTGTTLQIKLPGEGVARQATIEPGGAVRYYGDDGQLYEIGLTDRNLGTNDLPQKVPAGVPRVVSPDEVSDFGTRSAFGGQLSQASGQGKRYISDITGQTASPTSLVSGPIRTGNDFSGFGTAVTSNLLQSAGAQKKEIQLQQQREQMLQAQAQAAQQLQASQTFNLNQTPVQQLAGSGVLKRQLSVAAPTSAPRIVVAPPPVAPRVTSVSVAQPTQRVAGVSVAPAQPRLVVR